MSKTSFLKRFRSSVRWTSETLEKRLLLAADVVAVAPEIAAAVAAETSSRCADETTTVIDVAKDQVSECDEIIFVDSAVESLDQLANDVVAGAEMVVLDASCDGIDQITEILGSKRNVRTVHIVSHGSKGAIQLAGDTIDHQTLVKRQAVLRSWGRSFSNEADILVYGCDTASGREGRMFISSLAGLTGADVAASNDRTGHRLHNADWDLEEHVGTIEASIAFSRSLQATYHNHLPITIVAAGNEGDESMQLLINGSLAQTWNNIGGDAASGQFQSFTYNNAGSVQADQVRVQFTNDLYQPNVLDRNLRVDRIIIDGVDFQTEDASVFSTGTWLPDDGIQPGFRQSEYLHANGYFQYADPADSTQIQVRARGDEGGEQFNIRVAGSVVGSFTVSTDFQTFSANVSGDIAPSDVQVEFTNSDYRPAQNYDNNLVVDWMAIDGTLYQTENPTVYSTGTWKSDDGIQPGFQQSETLHANGYFQYGVGGNNGSTLQVRARGDEGGERFRVTIAGEDAGTFTASTVYQTFAMNASSSVDPSEVRIEFINSDYRPAESYDNNLVVDWISIDGTTYQTEASDVYSTGTWLPGDGIQPGFRQSETLHANGYLQYGADFNSGIIGLAVTQVTVDEDAGSVQVALTRYDGSDGAATASFQTLGIEAADGTDFIGTVDETVQFADGQTTAFATISLVDDDTLEQVETFSVSLFRTEGAQLGVPRTAIVTIVDDESGEGLVGHWRLDETGIGQTVVDSSEQTNDGIHQNIQVPNGPSTDAPDVESINPRGLRLDGENDYIQIGPDPSLNLSAGPFTQSVWIKPEHTDDGYHGVLGFQNGGSSANRYPGIWVYQRDRIHAGFGDGNNWNSFVTGSVLTPGQWNHVATTFDGTTYRAFVNGVAVYSDSSFAGRTPTTVSQLDIGRVDNYFQGGIDDVRIFNRALSPSEIGVLIDGAAVPPIPINGDFTATTLFSGFDTPIEVEWLPDGRMLVAEQDGLVQIVNLDGSIQSTPLLDIRSIVNSGTKDRGMIGFAVHPDFENNPYIYASYTYDPPQVNDKTGLGGPDGNGARVARISRFTVNSTGTYADPNSNVVLVGESSTYDNIGSPDIRPGLNDDHSCIDANGNPTNDCIPADETSHTIGELEFGPDGMLYAASGDGGSFGRVDPINLRALDIDSLAGKLLRIDPITGQGPSDNPFYNGDPNANQSKVYNYGLRNPFRFAINDVSGEVFIGDVGWTQWEEINQGAGANFGWPAFEGGNGTSQQTGGYSNLSEVQAYYATNPDVTAPVWARLHSDGGRAIVMGDFASDAYPGQYDGALLFTDIGDQVIRAMLFDADGNVSDVNVVSGQLGFIVDMQTGPDGYMYYVDITGSIGRLDFQIA